jgi:hypothetical protein
MNLRTLSLAAILATLPLPGSTWAVGLIFSHAYGEFVDRGDFTASLYSSDNVPLECPSSVSYAQTGNSITLTTRVAPPEQTAPAPCRTTSTVVLGALAAGTYQVTGRIRALDGTIAESVTQTLEVLPIEGRCNADPALSPSIVGTPKVPGPQFIARVQTDATFAASLGHPVVRLAPFGNSVYFDFPTLDDIPPAMDRLARSGTVDTLWRNGRACFSPSPPDRIDPMVEFYHAASDLYFYSADAGEIAAIDAGQVGGWNRTGKSFRVVTVPGCEFADGQGVVYRFMTARAGAAHVFVRDRAECSVVHESGNWHLEGIPFWASKPNPDGSCDVLISAGLPRVPLYRAWRPTGVSAHRFSTERSVIAEMVAKGWVDEGPVMCVLAPR